MGPVSSTLSTGVFMENTMLDLDDAICQALHIVDYLHFVNLVLPYGQEASDHDDFDSGHWECSEIEENDGMRASTTRDFCHQIRPNVKANTYGTNVWRSQRVVQKKLYQTVMRDVVIKAEYFRRRFCLLGPPEWRDPAAIILSGISSSHGISVYPSIFPFVAPHILISPPPSEEEEETSMRNNSLNYQNHDHGNQLIVFLASLPGCPRVLNANESRYPFNLMMSLSDTIIGKAQAPPGCVSISPNVLEQEYAPEPPCLESDDERSHIPEHSQVEIDGKQLKDKFWLEEDDTDLPDLPEDW